MSYPYSSEQREYFDRSVTRPIYLVMLQFGQQLRFSTAGTVDAMGYAWQGVGASIQIENLHPGVQQASVTIPNANSAASALIADGVVNKRAEIWEYNNAEPNDCRLLINGYCSNVPQINEDIAVINISSIEDRASIIPRHRGTTAYMPQRYWIVPGKKVKWGGEDYVFQSGGRR